MRHLYIRKLNLVAVLAVVAIAAVGAYAFTASNTVPAHSAGAGVNTVSGYDVTFDPSNGDGYTFNAAGTTMVKVQFSLDHAANDVKVALTAGVPTQADWVDCSASGGSSPFTTACNLPAIPVEDGLNLSVAAVSDGQVTIAP